MSLISDLKARALSHGPDSKLASEMVEIYNEYREKVLDKEDYIEMMQEIIDVRAREEIDSDLVAQDYIINLANQLISL